MKKLRDKTEMKKKRKKRKEELKNKENIKQNKINHKMKLKKIYVSALGYHTSTSIVLSLIIET